MAKVLECELCKTEFVKTGRGRPPRCCDECRTYAAGLRADRLAARKCRVCGFSLPIPVGRGRPPKHCDRCRELKFNNHFLPEHRYGGSRKPALPSANPEVDEGFLYRNGKPIFLEQLTAYNEARAAKKDAETRAFVFSYLGLAG